MSEDTYDKAEIEVLKGLGTPRRKPWHDLMYDPTDPVQVERLLKSVEDYARDNTNEDLTALITRLENELAAIGENGHGAQND